MNSIIQSLFDRRSVRVYENRAVEEEHQRLILQSALQAPTAGNMALYAMIRITEPELKQRLAETCDNQSFIASAPFVVVFCADYQRWIDTFALYCPEIRPPGEGDFLLAVSDTLIAAQNAVVAAESLGIGSCYIGDIMENYEIHRKLLSLPQHVMPVCMLCFGYPVPSQKRRPKPSRPLLEEMVFDNGYKRSDSTQLLSRLCRQQNKVLEELPDFIQNFCKRKYNSDFSIEMSRSVSTMISIWKETKGEYHGIANEKEK